jgi:hypothetical protein
MKQHEREFFIYTIRSGNVVVKTENIKLIIKPPTIEQSVESCEIYNSSYEQAYIDGIMSEDEMLKWMKEQDLWSESDENRLNSIKKDIERLKLEIYNARNDKPLREKIRLYIRAAEKHAGLSLIKKNSQMQNTREGIATSDKISWLIKNTTFSNNQLYDFNEISLSYVVDEWQSSFLGDSSLRELARNEPWKSLWTIKSNPGIKLFSNAESGELTYNQKNLLIWSQMYDNIQESLECPSKEVIEDDDMLDGWFIVQSKKREKENAEREVDSMSKNEKIKNSSEVFVVAKDDEHAEKINKANDFHSNMIKKQREAFIKRAGSVNDHELPDQKLKIQTEQTNMFRGKIKGGR